MVLVQQNMIEQVCNLGRADDNISAILMYGSFIKGEGDRYSDIEFYLFHHRDFDHRDWVGRIRPVRLFFTNEFGTEVAVFDNLVRGEFHFAPLDEIEVIKSWAGLTTFEYAEKMNLLDKDGRLNTILSELDRSRPNHRQPDQIDWLAKSLLNNLLMVANVLARGEWAHAQQGFQYIQKYLLWLIRLSEGADNHWENPTKALECEISLASYRAYAACVPSLESNSLKQALAAAITLAKDLFDSLAVDQSLMELLEEIKESGQKELPTL